MYHAWQKTAVGWQQALYNEKPETDANGYSKSSNGSGFFLRGITKLNPNIHGNTLKEIFGYFDEQENAREQRSTTEPTED